MQSLDRIAERFLILLGIRNAWAHMHARQLTRFILTGGSALMIDLSLLTFFVEIALLPIIVAGPCTTALMLMYVYTLNKYWTFGNTESKHIEHGIKFLMVYGSSFILVNVITWFLAEIILIWYIISRMIAVALCAFWNYAWMHAHVFGGRTK